MLKNQIKQKDEQQKDWIQESFLWKTIKSISYRSCNKGKNVLYMNLWTAKVFLHVLNAHNFMIGIFPDVNLPMKIMDCTILAEANTTINTESTFLISPEIRM